MGVFIYDNAICHKNGELWWSFFLVLNKLLNKQSSCLWYVTSWQSYDVTIRHLPGIGADTFVQTCPQPLLQHFAPRGQSKSDPQRLTQIPNPSGKGHTPVWYTPKIRCTVSKYIHYICMRVVYIHYNDVIMGAIASQIPSLTIVFSTVYLDTDQRKHQSSSSLAFVRGIHRRPVNSPQKWPVTRKMFPFDDVIMCTMYFRTLAPATGICRRYIRFCSPFY